MSVTSAVPDDICVRIAVCVHLILRHSLSGPPRAADHRRMDPPAGDRRGPDDHGVAPFSDVPRRPGLVFAGGPAGSRGEVLYRDVAWAYGPLPAQVLAMLFRWLAPDAGLATAVNAILAGLSVLLTYAALRQLSPAGYALGFTAFAAIAGPYVGGGLMRLHLYTYTQAVAWGATASLGRVGARSVLATARSGRVAAGGRTRRRHGVPQQAGVRTGGPGRRHRRDRGCAGRLRVGALPGNLRGDPGRRVGLAGQRGRLGGRCGEGTRAMGSWARVVSGARAGACCAGWPACTCSDWRCWPMPPAARGGAGRPGYLLAGLAGLAVAALIAPDLLGMSGREVLAGLRAGAWPAVRVAPAILLQWLAAAPWGLLFWVLLGGAGRQAQRRTAGLVGAVGVCAPCEPALRDDGLCQWVCRCAGAGCVVVAGSRPSSRSPHAGRILRR